MESILLDIGINHFWSKSLPYFFSILMGVGVAIFLIKKMRNSNVWVRLALAFICALLTFSLYFAFSPIYEGDFGSSFTEVDLETRGFKIKNGLIVFAIPGCPHCLEAIDMLKVWKKRDEKLNCEFLVFPTSYSSKTRKYERIVDGEFPVSLLDDSLLRSTLNIRRFPSFAKIENGRLTKLWANNEFGVFAKDEF
jgi:hypothetical protein